MARYRKRNRNADPIIINSSSDTSEASEDSAPESDIDSPSKAGGYAAENDMSKRQTRKINSGSFGMFNRPTLTPRTPRTPNSGQKKRRVKEYSGYTESTRSSERSGRRQRCMPGTFMVDDDEDEQSLFVPETAPQSPGVMRRNRRRGSRGNVVSEVITVPYDESADQSLTAPQLASRPRHIVIDDESESEEILYNDLTPKRARKTKEYIQALDLVESADDRLQTVEKELNAATTEHSTLSFKLVTIDITADNKISDINRERDEAIKLATEHAEVKIQRIRERLPAKKVIYEGRLHACAERRKTFQDCIADARAQVETAMEERNQLERHGGFELCSDVRKVQARKKGKRR